MGALPGIAFLIVGLLVSVGLHEIGHLVPAKKFGTKVSQYFIGFGPTLWSKTVRGTEYGVKAIPLGGFVRIAGMLAPGRADRVTVDRRGRTTIAEEARQASAEEVGPDEQHMAFWRLSAGKRLIVMFGGPFMNLLLAAVLLCITMSVIGSPVPSNQLSAVVPCVSASECTDTDPVSPGYAAGLQPGDTITAWGDVVVHNWEDIQTAIARGGDSPVAVSVVRDGVETTLTVTPQLTERPVFYDDGTAATDDNGAPLTEMKPYVGISPAYTLARESIARVPGQLVDLSVGTARIVAKLPVTLWNTATGLVNGGSRDANGVVGVVGVADLAGHITSSDSAVYSTAARVGDLLRLLASLNISLFIFNLIPLLPLDGGHILGALYEGARRAWASLRGKADPGPVDMARLMPLSYGVGLFFIGMTVLLIIADIVNPVF